MDVMYGIDVHLKVLLNKHTTVCHGIVLWCHDAVMSRWYNVLLLGPCPSSPHVVLAWV